MTRQIISQPSGHLPGQIARILTQPPFQGTFPDRQNSPARCNQPLLYVLVTRAISLDLGSPKGCTRGRETKQRAVMPMPEATVNHDHRPITGKNKVRCPRQTFVIQPVAKPKTVKGRTYHTFRNRVATTYASHHAASGFLVDAINQHRPLLYKMAHTPRQSTGTGSGPTPEPPAQRQHCQAGDRPGYPIPGL